MPTLLHIDSSPLGGASISRQLSTEFVENWKKTNPNGKVITRDLTTSQLTPVNAEWIGAVYTPGLPHSRAARAPVPLRYPDRGARCGQQ